MDSVRFKGTFRERKGLPHLGQQNVGNQSSGPISTKSCHAYHLIPSKEFLWKNQTYIISALSIVAIAATLFTCFRYFQTPVSSAPVLPLPVNPPATAASAEPIPELPQLMREFRIALCLTSFNPPLTNSSTQLHEDTTIGAWSRLSLRIAKLFIINIFKKR
jgi:hypothetical protein